MIPVKAMKQSIRDLMSEGGQSGDYGAAVLVAAVILAVAFFGFIIFDAYRVRRRIRRMRGRDK